MTTHDPKTYEAQLEELTSLVDKLESGDKSLDEALQLFEKGVKLTSSLQKKLDSAEQKVTTLIDNGGQPVAAPGSEIDQ